MKLKNVVKTSVSKADRFQAGNIKFFWENWKRITSDKYILDIVKHGLKLEFLSVAPHREPFQATYNTKENGIISQKICFAYGQVRSLDGFCGSQRCILFCTY